jgi:membrane AbrB-like protein
VIRIFSPFLPPTIRNAMPSMLGWFALTLCCYLLGDAARTIGIPAPHLLMSLGVGVAVALSGFVHGQVPKPMNRASQAIVGVLMGSYLDPGSVRAVAASIGPLAAVTLATILLCVTAAVLLPRLTSMLRADAVLGMVPGGSAAIIACADELDADARIVAFMQYVRVALVAATAPVVVLAIGSSGSTAATHSGFLEQFFGPTRLVTSAHPVAGLTILAALCVLGPNVGRRLGLPAPTLLGPMLIAGVAVLTGAAQGFAPDGLLQDLVFVVVGLEVGLRFTRSSVRQVGRCVPHVLLATAAVCTACAVLAGILEFFTDIPFMDAYLATTPGGINAVLATAASTHGNVALISTAQSLRLFAVVLLAPPLIRRLTQSENTSPADDTSGDDTVDSESELIHYQEKSSAAATV